MNRQRFNYDSFINKKYNYVRILKIIRGHRQTKVKCLCKCNRLFKANFVDVISSHTKSCGCYRPKWSIARRKKQSKLLAKLNIRDKKGRKQNKDHIKKMTASVRHYFRYHNAWNKGIAPTRKTRIKLSKALKGRPCPWVRVLGTKRYWYYGKDRRIKMRSTWEVKYAKWLDKQEIEWAYEPICFVGKRCSYSPDFYLLKERKFIEIKGARINLNRKKINMVRKFGATIEVLFGNDLKNLGVLRKSEWTGRRPKNAVV